MAVATEHLPYMSFIPAVLESPQKEISFLYDREADVVYINFDKSRKATDSELTGGDIIIRYNGDEIIGYTMLHASRRGFPVNGKQA
jgi:uncharacterized protein YuzE